MKFKKITVECSSETSETVAYALHEAGSIGEVFDDYNNVKKALDEKNWDYADASLFTPSVGCRVSGFFNLETDETAVIKELSRLKECDWADFSCLKFDVETIDSQDWENEWKKYYEPFNIGNFVIVPEWINYSPKPGDVLLHLNPGLAFGTGMHETTSMCVELLQKIPVKGSTVLDLGCGSGILGIAAKILGADDVMFFDIDEQAITATEYNSKLNGIADPKVFHTDIRKCDFAANVIVANITADVLIDLENNAFDIQKRYRDVNGGSCYSIISGIITEKAEKVKDAFSKHYIVSEHLKKNDWNAFLLRLK